MAPLALGGPWAHPVRLGFAWGCEVLVERLGLGRRASAGSQRDNSDHTDCPALGKGQDVARPDGPRGFRDPLGVDTNVTVGDLPRSQGPRLEEPGVPQPFVNAQTGRGSEVGQG